MRGNCPSVGSLCSPFLDSTVVVRVHLLTLHAALVHVLWFACPYQQAEAFYARQTGWLRAKQEHDDRERDRRLKSLAAPGAGGKRRGGSAKPKLVSAADAEAFFASEVACKQRREEAIEKLREEARLQAAAREAAGEVDCCTRMRYGLTNVQASIAFHELYKSTRCACGSFRQLSSC